MTALALIGVAALVGRIFGLKGAALAALAGGLWAAFLVALMTAPGSFLARMPGMGIRGWTVLGGLVAVACAYASAIGWLRRRAGAGAEPVKHAHAPGPKPRPGTDFAAPLTDPELDRYARHIVLRELGGPGQRRLKNARVLVVGAGGLGAPVLQYLVAAGVGRITVADDDTVKLPDLQRQILFGSADIGRLKVEAAASRLHRLNPHVTVTPVPRRIGAGDEALVGQHDLVLDGTDSFAARAAINALCVQARVPLIAGAIAQWEGQIALYDPARGGPCMACIFPEAPAPGLAPDCAEAGVVGALPGVVGSMMALEAIKHLAGITGGSAGGGAGAELRGRMVLFDGLWGENRALAIRQRVDCPVCGGIGAMERPQHD